MAGSEAGDRDPHDSMAAPLPKAAEARPDEEELHRGTSPPASGGDARPDEEELHRASGGDARPDEEELRRGTSSPASGGDTQAHHVAQEEDAQGDPFPMDSVPDDSGAPDAGAAADAGRGAPLLGSDASFVHGPPDTLCRVVRDPDFAALQGAAAGYLEASVGSVIQVLYVGREDEELEAGWLYGELLVDQRTGATPRDRGWIPTWAVKRMRTPWAVQRMRTPPGRADLQEMD